MSNVATRYTVPELPVVTATEISSATARVSESDELLMRELLSALSVVSTDTLSQVQDIARLKGRPAVQVLVDSGFLAAADARALTAAHDVIKDGVVHRPWAIACLQRAISEFVPYDEMMRTMELHPLCAFNDSALAEFCLTNALITTLEFEQARRKSLSFGFSIGQSLLKLEYLTIDSYKMVLDLLAMRRSGQISEEGAREIVRQSGYNYMRFDRKQGAVRSGTLRMALTGVAAFLCDTDTFLHDTNTLPALDLLISARCLDEVTVLGLIEDALEVSSGFDSIFEESLGFGPVVLTTARKMQALIFRGELNVETACRMLVELVKQQ